MSELTRRHGDTEKLSRRGRRARRGISLIVVVMLVSLAMAVSFAVVHSQGTAMRIQQNATLRVDARQAAQAGMAVALRESCRPNWSGVDTSISGDLSQSESFHATFSTGDATLAEDDPEYAEYPYRVTILVTGLAHDPSHPERQATHEISAVIRLVPQAIDDEPPGWDEIQQNTFCQWEKNDTRVTLPCRIEGPVRIRGRLKLCEDEIDWSDTVRLWYLAHLNFMRNDGWPDYRPFNGPIRIAHSEQEQKTLDLLTGALGVDISDADTGKIYSWTMPMDAGSYRLYPGGKIYYAETIDADLSDTTLKPDPKTNPLGIFIGNGETRLYENVSLEGTLINNGDVKILGGTNTFISLSVPPYSHRDFFGGTGIRLPTVVSNNFRVEPGASVAAKGLVMAKDNLEIKSDYQYDMSVTIQGNAMAKDLDIKPRIEWRQTKGWWDDWLAIYWSHFYPAWYFPALVQTFSEYELDPQPLIWIRPEAGAAPYHWYNGNNPLFKQSKDSDGNDAGLRWELISWTNNP
jgi:hypothetical protein